MNKHIRTICFVLGFIVFNLAVLGKGSYEEATAFVAFATMNIVYFKDEKEKYK